MTTDTFKNPYGFTMDFGKKDIDVTHMGDGIFYITVTDMRNGTEAVIMNAEEFNAFIAHCQEMVNA